MMMMMMMMMMIIMMMILMMIRFLSNRDKFQELFEAHPRVVRENFIKKV